jgi:hypothetical protein
VNFNQPTPLSYTDQLTWYEEQVLTKKAFPYIAFVNKLRVGYVALQNVNWYVRSAEISHFILPEFNSKALAYHIHSLMIHTGFNSLNLNRIYSVCFSFNDIKDELLRLGFQVEGTLKQSCYKDGKYWDSYLLAILHENYQSLSNGLQ